jgi:hypothetical protein
MNVEPRKIRNGMDRGGWEQEAAVAEDPPADPEVWGLVKPPGSNS